MVLLTNGKEEQGKNDQQFVMIRGPMGGPVGRPFAISAEFYVEFRPNALAFSLEKVPKKRIDFREVFLWEIFDLEKKDPDQSQVQKSVTIADGIGVTNKIVDKEGIENYDEEKTTVANVDQTTEIATEDSSVAASTPENSDQETTDGLVKCVEFWFWDTF